MFAGTPSILFTKTQPPPEAGAPNEVTLATEIVLK